MVAHLNACSISRKAAGLRSSDVWLFLFSLREPTWSWRGAVSSTAPTGSRKSRPNNETRKSPRTTHASMSIAMPAKLVGKRWRSVATTATQLPKRDVNGVCDIRLRGWCFHHFSPMTVNGATPGASLAPRPDERAAASM